MPELVEGPHGEGSDSWSYRISFCEPLPREQTPANCAAGIVHARDAPRMVRFKRADYDHNSSHLTPGDCQNVATNVVLAEATYHDLDPITNTTRHGGLQLVFAGEYDGRMHTVTANLICDRVAGIGVPGAVRFQHFGNDPATAVETYEFDWITEAACPPLPPPPCDEHCVCAGVDLSLLKDTYDATGVSFIDYASGQSCDPSNSTCTKKIDGWQYKVSVCNTVRQDEMPDECDHVDSWSAQVVQFAEKDNVHVQQSGCKPVGTTVTTAERTQHGVKLTWEDTQSQMPTRVEGEFICMEDGIGHIERMDMEVQNEGSSQQVTEFQFRMDTMAACSPAPAPPSLPNYVPDICDANCVCDGQDLSNLRGTHTLADADQTKKWVYKLAVCSTVSRAGLPPSCEHVATNATALRFENEGDAGKEPLCEQIGSASIKATHTINRGGVTDGVDLIYSFASEQCRGGCEVQLKVQCVAGDVANTQPGRMLDISTQNDPNGGSEYFATWVAQCVTEPPAPEKDSHTVLIVAVVAVMVVLGGSAAFVVLKRRRSAQSSDSLDEPFIPARDSTARGGSE